MIYLLITTSLLDKNGISNISKQNRYIECISKLLQFLKNNYYHDIKPIIVENNGIRQTFLDDFNCDVFYTDNNKISLINEAGNELLDIKDVINKYNIQDDDFIIKINGLYELFNTTIINLVKKNMNDFDVFIKFFNISTQEYVFDNCLLGLFAIKCKYLKEFNYNFVLTPESEFALYIRINVNSHLQYGMEFLYLNYWFEEDSSVLVV